MRLPDLFYRFRFLLIAFIALIVVGILPLQRVAAQASSNLNPDVEQNDHTKAQSVLINLSSALICQLIGVDVVDPQHGCLTIDPSTNKLGYAGTSERPQLGGLFGLTINSISSIYKAPASSGEYIHYLADNFGIGPKTYAAQTTQGFSSLVSLQKMWITMRNLSYLLFTLVFVFIGLAIMLRIKIDPRTVMSIQNQIPKVIIGIFLITFSYAIVGFLVDMMWVVTYAGINILASDTRIDLRHNDQIIIIDDTFNNAVFQIPDTDLAQLKADSEKKIADLKEGSRSQSDINTILADSQRLIAAISQQSHHTGEELYKDIVKYNTDNGSTSDNASLRKQATQNLLSNPLSYVDGLFSAGRFGKFDGILGLSYDIGRTMGDVISRTVSSLLGLDHDAPCSVRHIIASTLGGGCISQGFQGLITILISALGFLIVAVAIFIALIRTWFTLMKSLVYVICYTILGPLMITIGLLPGSTFNFSRWIRAIIAHLAIFPAAVFLFIIASVFAADNSLNNPQQGAFVPPLISNPNLFDNFGVLIAFGMIMVGPELLGWVESALKAKPGPVGAAVAKGFGTGIPYATATPKAVWKRMNEFDPHKGRMGAAAYWKIRASQKLGGVTFGLLDGSSKFNKWKAEEDKKAAAFRKPQAGAPTVVPGIGGNGIGKPPESSSSEHH